MWSFPTLPPPPPLPEARSFVGVLFAISGNVVISIGLNLQKLAHNRLRTPKLTPSTATSTPTPSPLPPERRTAEPANVRGPYAQQRWLPRSSADGSPPCGNSMLSALYPPPLAGSPDSPAGHHPADGKSAGGRSGQESPTVFRTPPETPQLARPREDTIDEEPPQLPQTTVFGPEPGITQPAEPQEGVFYLTNKVWWVGIFLLVLGELGNFAAYGFAPASVIAPLGTVTIMSNAVFAHFVLKENFRKQDAIGILLAVIGAIILVLSSKQSEIQLSPEALIAAIEQLKFVIYVACTLVSGVILYFLSESIGSTYSVIDLTVVAIAGGYTVLSTKAISSLLGLVSIRLFEYPMTYGILIVLIITAIIQVKYINKALQRFDSSEVIPTQWTLFTISAIIGSAVLYNDFDEMTPSTLTNFALGCAMTFSGVYFISSGRNAAGTPQPFALLQSEGDISEATALLGDRTPSRSLPTSFRERPAASRSGDPAALRRWSAPIGNSRSPAVIPPLTFPCSIVASSSAASRGSFTADLSRSEPSSRTLYTGRPKRSNPGSPLRARSHGNLS